MIELSLYLKSNTFSQYSNITTILPHFGEYLKQLVLTLTLTLSPSVVC